MEFNDEIDELEYELLMGEKKLERSFAELKHTVDTGFAEFELAFAAIGKTVKELDCKITDLTKQNVVVPVFENEALCANEVVSRLAETKTTKGKGGRGE